MGGRVESIDHHEMLPKRPVNTVRLQDHRHPREVSVQSMSTGMGMLPASRERTSSQRDARKVGRSKGRRNSGG